VPFASHLQPPLAFAAVEGAEVEAEQLREPEAGQQGGGDEGKVGLGPLHYSFPAAGTQVAPTVRIRQSVRVTDHWGLGSAVPVEASANVVADAEVALVRFLSSTGARAEEICGAAIGELDRPAERPIWRVGRSKGDKARDVPFPRATVDAVDQWLAERVRAKEGPGALPARPADPLFVRADGSALSPQALDRLVRGLAGRAGVVLPTGAAAHAFRHHYGVTLALRGVPGNVISQLMGHADPRTTSVYTTVASVQLIAALDDAGLLG